MTRWVQISDIHFKYSNYDTEDLREKLLDKLAEIKAVSYLMMSGDLLYKFSEDTEEVEDYITKVRKALGIKKNAVYMCPGNHDVDRNLVKRNNLIDEIRKRATGEKGQLQCTKEEFDELADMGHSRYKSIYKNITARKHTPVKTFEPKDAGCRIITIDSTLLSKDASDEKHLNVRYSALQKIGKKENLLNIAIMHHGIDFFDDLGERAFQHWVDDKAIDIVICGHSHRAGIRTYEDSKFEIKQFTCGAPLIDGYAIPSFFVFDYDEKKWIVDVQLYTYSIDRHDWILDTQHLRAFPDGHYRYRVLRKYDYKLKEISGVQEDGVIKRHSNESVLSREKTAHDIDGGVDYSEVAATLSRDNYICSPDDVIAMQRLFIDNLDEKFHRVYGFNVTSSKYNSDEKFSSIKMLRSLVEIEIPTDKALLILYNVIELITSAEYIERNGDRMTTKELRTCIYKEICNLPDSVAEAVDSDIINSWATKYARRYGHNNRRICLELRDGSTREISFEFIRNDLVKDLVMNVTGMSEAEYKKQIPPKEIKKMALDILDFIKSCEMYSLKYDTLLDFIEEMAVEPPHPWMLRDDGRERFLQYHFEVLNKHKDTIENKMEDKITMLETLYHSTALLLGMYTNIIGVEELSPLYLLKESLFSYGNKKGLKGVLTEEGLNKMLADLREQCVSRDKFIKSVSALYELAVKQKDFASLEVRKNIVEFRDLVIQVYEKRIGIV